ncbi:hypothetical protein CFOL_v3_02958 [Cephalotus follicularis]|uniref:RING-type E3 ubiquitin transferase n=1 Tax=Cephalotus follicularis TaxID=3775 RepID=A0A1Q3AUL5_CEPFO|nr:hypothetical protein CFOL_v3_02958 [Cephalotus follicularis]
MDDSCAVCADSLEWVAYGACGHREVCSTCVARLRFICEDRRCCICKTESDIVFVTKALGDYTHMINDFSVLPSEVREGQVGSYWYHEDTQAFFNDVDQYRMIKAMCRLSCSVCDMMEEQSTEGPKRPARFRNIEQLKGHLFHRHRLLMCSLCLEGRKVFICEQKLYNRAQLNQHISTGDSEVDGSESERGGFMGHPMCEFCKTPFYGDNELYSHMSTEHYTCHICQRQHPGQYEYYKNYDDLEIHFRRDHFLCEDEACLAKKFVVFQSEAEMKRHNAIEHGGRMSRSKRNAALQIPTSFLYCRGNEQGHRRGRGRTFHREPSDNQLSMAIQASFESASIDFSLQDPSSSRAVEVSDHSNTNDVDPIMLPLESLDITDSESSSRYLQALGHSSRDVPLEESSFPPLPMAPRSSQQKPKNSSAGLPNNTMAAHLRRKNNGRIKVINSAQAWPATSRGLVQPFSNSTQFIPPSNVAPVGSQNTGSISTAPSYASPAQVQARPMTVNRVVSGGSSRIIHSASAPNLADTKLMQSSDFDFPPVSAAQMRKLPSSGEALLNGEDVHTANKSLVEKIRAALGHEEDRYSAFKGISGQYRQGSIDTKQYFDYVQQYGLTHLVLELARLCPDEQKQKDLVETYNVSLRNSAVQVNGWSHGSVGLRDSSGSKKGKGKSVNAEDSNLKDTLANKIIGSDSKLPSSYKPADEEVEVLSKDGYRAVKGKSKVTVQHQHVELSSAGQPSTKPSHQTDLPSTMGGSIQSSADGKGGSKQRKKTSKFHRVRLGDGSMATLLDIKNSDPDPQDNRLDGSQNPNGGLPVRGVWRSGGGQKLFS